MLELPECVVIAGQMNETIQGRTITEAVAGHSPHKFAFFNGDPAPVSYTHLDVYKRQVIYPAILARGLLFQSGGS